MLKIALASLLSFILVIPSIATARTSPSARTRATSTGEEQSSAATQMTTGSRREDASSIRSQIRTGKRSTPRDLKFQFLTQSYFYQRDLAQGERPLASTYNYVGASWRFADNQYLAVRLPFSYYDPKGEGDSYAEIEDMYLNYWHAEMGRFSKDTVLQGMLRVYLPTGEDARFLDKRQGAVRGALMTQTDFSRKLDLNYTVYAQYNNHTQETYKINDRTWGNIDRSFVQGATLSYDITDKITISQLLGTTHEYAETGQRFYDDTEHFVNAVSTLYYQITNGVSASLAFHNDVELWDDRRPFRLLMDEDITYVFSLGATL